MSTNNGAGTARRRRDPDGISVGKAGNNVSGSNSGNPPLPTQIATTSTASSVGRQIGVRSSLKEHTEQPEDDPNKLIPTKYDSDDDEETGDDLAKRASNMRVEATLTEDIYSLMYTAPVCSSAFYFAISVFIIQIAILILIFVDLVNLTEDPTTASNGESNRLNLPAGVELNVRVAQFFGVILTVNFTAAGGDLFNGMDFLFNGFDHEVEKNHPGATRRKWALAGSLQALVGIFMILDLFLLLMKSSDVVGLCLNFAALHFVQDIDDVAFKVAQMGLVSRKIEKEVNGVGDIKILGQLKNRTQWMRRVLMAFLLIVLYIWFFVIASWQWSGRYRCDYLLVQFGDAYNPELAYYSGPFAENGTQSSRPKYVDESGTIKLRYSRTVKAWVFEPNTDEKGNVIIMSSETTSFDVTSVGAQPWFQNTTSGFVPVDWLSLRCNECNQGSCPAGRGVCADDQSCVCDDGYIGPNCEAEAPTCEWYGLDFRTKESLANIPGGSFFFDNQFQGLSWTRLYGRYVYLPYHLYTFYDARVQNFIIFTGRRWVIMSANETAVPPTTAEVYDLLNQTVGNPDVSDYETLKFLANSDTYTPLFFSSPVDFGTPSDGYEPSTVTWVFAEEEDNADDFAFFGYGPNDANALDARFLCSECSNNTEDLLANCQNGGICSDIQNYCHCLPFYAGYQCEYVLSCNEVGCFNGGKCNTLAGVCEECFRGAHGNLCQYPLPDNVQKNPFFCAADFYSYDTAACENRQECDPFELKCVCESPFYGEFCELSTQATCGDYDTVVDDVDFKDPCQNGGYCDTYYWHHPICRCPESFSGDFCEVASVQ